MHPRCSSACLLYTTISSGNALTAEQIIGHRDFNPIIKFSALIRAYGRVENTAGNIIDSTENAFKRYVCTNKIIIDTHLYL